jgi:hypothetical protein
VFEGNVFYLGLIVLAFIIKDLRTAKERVRQEMLLAILMVILIKILTATSPTRFTNYGQNIAFMDIEKSLRF